MTTQETTAGFSDERRFELLVSNVSDYAIYMLDLSGRINSWNAGAQRFKGYTASEIIGKHFSLFYTPEDQQNNRPARALRTAREEGRFEDEGWRGRKDGTRFWANVVIDPIRDPEGNLVGFAKVTRDITERKAAEEALRGSEERFRLLVQGVTDYAIYMLAPDGVVTNWNSGAERIKGYTHDEIVGQHFSCFYTPEDRQAGSPAKTLAVAASVGRFEQEGWRVRKDGTRFWAHVVVDAVHDDHQKLIGFAKITRDVTERKLAAEALERANAALFQSQKMEAVGQLTGGIAHDFNNLLTVLSSSMDLLTMRLSNPSDIRILDTMRRAVERGATLTQQLLSFARKQPLQVQNCDLNVVIAGFEAVLKRAGNSSIEIDFAYVPELRMVAIDVARFEAALLNLVVNARDAMPEGGKIIVAVNNADLKDGDVGTLKAGAFIAVTVSDTGTGMAERVIARAFEPFFTTKEVGKGSGLGLSQVYGFIAQSGGEVQIDSKEGQGTTIRLYLPAIEDSAVESKSAPAASQEMILMVDDEPDVLDIGAELCRSIGYQVLTANNAKEALEMLNRSANISILFTDVVMPQGMHGLELARTARALLPQLKVVLASGYPLPMLKEQHGPTDAFTFIAKPYRLADLAQVLRTAT
ncbi:hybrid sensor histidine kinase/response regulator [Caballeronia sordidicola]|uniref:hybrid sensor histidine kinase/response regulator n=1 Tax=Caballeronia sordidicola TaxID=196367 RepID=UPI00094D7F97|nr:PAS domain-containing sensor histidine kinase [Caballeronia sordidicola]